MKVFSVEEANALLPSVRGSLSRIQRIYKQILSYKTAAKYAADGAEQGGGGMPEGPLYVSLLVNLFSQTRELETLGVQLKDHARGLIDFPSLRDGRVILLCWQLGEGDEIEWWHDIEDGFAGRQPL
jgi:hypothetical protein